MAVRGNIKQNNGGVTTETETVIARLKNCREDVGKSVGCVHTELGGGGGGGLNLTIKKSRNAASRTIVEHTTEDQRD